MLGILVLLPAQAIIGKLHNHTEYRAAAASPSFRQEWPQSAELFWQLVEQVVFTTDWDTQIGQCMRSGKSASDTLEVEEIKAELDALDEEWNKERPAKPTEAPPAVAGGAGADAAAILSESAAEEEHMPTGQGQRQKDNKLSECQKAKVKRYRKTARQLIDMWVEIVVEPPTQQLLTKAIQESKAGQAKASSRVDESGQEPTGE